jgi:hypothetical protein
MPSNVNFWLNRANRPGQADAPGLPCSDDLRLFEKFKEHLRRTHAGSEMTGLVLGATRQIADWCRKNDLSITVMDFCEPIVRDLQSSHLDWNGLEISVEDWLLTNRRSNSFCWAAGDGVVNAVGSGRNAIQLFRQIYRLLLPESFVFLRNLLRPSPTPTTSDVFAKFKAGQIRSFSAFRHQVSQSLQTSFMDGISTRVTRDVILSSGVLNSDNNDCFRRHDGKQSELDYYATEGGALCYPTLTELRSLTDANFEELDISYGSYEMAELVPTIVYRTRPKS